MSTAVMTYKAGDQPVPGYTLVEELGSGSFGEVWKARAPGDTEVAIKIVKGLDQDGARREFDSLRDAKKFNHPNLTKIFAFWVKDEDGEILAEDAVMESTTRTPQAEAPLPTTSLQETMQVCPVETDVEEPLGATSAMGRSSIRRRPAQLIIAMGLGDKTLAHRLKECRADRRPGEPGGIPVDELLRYMESVGRALKYLNVDRKVQHCDIKPQNVLLVSGEAQVCDFSVVKRMTENLRQTTTGGFTEYYAPPEAFKQEFSNRFDQYSLGVTYAELRTGCLPFEGDTRGHVYAAKLTGKLDLSKLPPAEQAVISKATALNPDDRYDSVPQMVEALYEAVYPPAPVHKPRRRVWDVAVLIVLLAAAAAIAFLMFVLPAIKRAGKFDEYLAKGEYGRAAETLAEMRPGSSRDKLRNQLLESLASWESPPENRQQHRELVFQTLAKVLEITSAADAAEPPSLDWARLMLQQDLDRVHDQLNGLPGFSALEPLQGDVAAIQRDLSAIQTHTDWSDLEASSQLARQRIAARGKSPVWDEIRAGLEACQAESLEGDASFEVAYQVLLATALLEINSQPGEQALLENEALRGACAAATAAADKLGGLPDLSSKLPWEHARWTQIRRDIFSQFVATAGTRAAPSNEMQRKWEDAFGSDFSYMLRMAMAEKALQDHRFAEARDLVRGLQTELGESSATVLPGLRPLELSLRLSDPEARWQDAVEDLRASAAQLDPASMAELGDRLVERLTRELPAAEPTLGESLDQLSAAWGAVRERVRDESQQRQLAAQQRLLTALAALVEPLEARLQVPPSEVTRATPADASDPSSGDASPAKLSPAHVAVDLLTFERQLGGAKASTAPSTTLVDRAQQLRSGLAENSPSYLITYADYLGALAGASNTFRLEEAADQVAGSIERDVWLFRAARGVRAREVLLSAAASRLPTDEVFKSTKDPGQPVEIQFWVDAAGKVPVPPDASLRVAQFFAAALSKAVSQDPQHDPQAVIARGTELLSSEDGLQALQSSQQLDLVRLLTARALLARAERSQGESQVRDVRQALRYLAALLDSRFAWLPPEVSYSDDARLDQLVIEPAIAGTKLLGMDPTADGAVAEDLRIEVAKIYGMRGRIQERGLAAKSREGIEAREKAFQAASDWFPASLYKCGLGRAIYDDRSLSLAEKAERLKPLADEALRLAQASSGDTALEAGEAWALMGEAHHIEGLSYFGADEQRSRLTFQAALEAYDNALSRIATQAPGQVVPPWRTRCLVFRSAAYVELAYLETQRDGKKELLEQAVRDAREATEDIKSSLLPEAYNALGNAYEDIAWKVYHRPADYAQSREHYQYALEAFERAVENATRSTDRPKALMNAGRCSFRYAVRIRDREPNSPEIQQLLNQARSRLEVARTEPGLDDNSALRGQIAWLISDVLRLLPRDAAPPEGISDPFTNSEQALQEAVAVAAAKRDRDWALFQKAWAKAAMDVTDASGQQPAPSEQQVSAFKERASEVIRAAQDVREDNPVTFENLWDLLIFARRLGGTRPAEWLASFASNRSAAVDPSDPRFRHRALLNIYRHYYVVSLQPPPGRTIAQRQAYADKILEAKAGVESIRGLDSMPASSDREILQLLTEATKAMCTGAAAIRHTDQSQAAVDILASCEQLSEITARLDGGLSTAFPDLDMDAEIRILLGNSTKTLLRWRAAVPQIVTDANARRLKQRALQSLKPLLENPALPDRLKRTVQGLNEELHGL